MLACTLSVLSAEMGDKILCVVCAADKERGTNLMCCFFFTSLLQWISVQIFVLFLVCDLERK